MFHVRKKQSQRRILEKRAIKVAPHSLRSINNIGEEEVEAFNRKVDKIFVDEANYSESENNAQE